MTHNFPHFDPWNSVEHCGTPWNSLKWEPCPIKWHFLSHFTPCFMWNSETLPTFTPGAAIRHRPEVGQAATGTDAGRVQPSKMSDKRLPDH